MKYLLPDSSAGQVESQIFWLRHEAPVMETAVFGDSRVGEGFSATVAKAATGGRLNFRNMGVAGSTPRVWYYLLRDADPDRTRFSTVVIGIGGGYTDEDGGDQATRISDLNYLVGRLRLADCPDFVLSFAPEFRERAAAGCVLRGIPLRSDIHALLENPSARFAVAEDWRNHGHSYIDGYGGKPEDLSGLTVDFASRTIHFPQGAKDWQTDTAKATLLPERSPQAGKLREYRRKWFGRIVDLYAGTKAKIVFVQLPRAPLPPPPSTIPAYAISELSKRANVVVTPPDIFTEMERPELFADGLHLNHTGRALFSEKLAKVLVEGGAR